MTASVKVEYEVVYAICVILCLAVLAENRLVTDRLGHRHRAMAYTALA